MSKRPLFIFSFKAIAFATLFVLCVSFFKTFIPFEKDERIVTGLEFLESTKDSIAYDVLFFSNSYVFTAFDPLYFKSLTGLNTLHIASSSQRTVFTVETIRQALGIYKPKCIVLDLSRSSTFLPQDEKYWTFNTKGLIALRPTASKARMLLGLAFQVENPAYLFNSFSEFTYSLAHLNRWKQFSVQDNTVHIPKGYYGFSPLVPSLFDRDTSHIDWNKSYLSFPAKTPPSFFDAFSRRHFINFLEEYRNSGIAIILVSSIKLNSFKELGFMLEFQSLKNHAGRSLSYINLNAPAVKQYLSLNKRHFYNQGHLSHDGALLVTEYVAPIIKQRIPGASTVTVDSRTLIFNQGLQVRDYQLVLNDEYDKVLQIYIDNIPEFYRSYTTVIYIYPKPGHGDKLTSSSRGKGYDSKYLEVSKYHRTKNSWVGHLELKTKLKKSEIERIELWFYKPNSPSSGKHIIYQCPSDDGNGVVR